MTNMTTVPSDKLKEMQQAMAEQAAVIEKLKSAIGAWERAEANELQDAEAGLINTMNTPTDSKQILAEWLDGVLGEPVAHTNETELSYAHYTRQDGETTSGSFWKDYDEDDAIPLFKKPELL